MFHCIRDKKEQSRGELTTITPSSEPQAPIVDWVILDRRDDISLVGRVPVIQNQLNAGHKPNDAS